MIYLKALIMLPINLLCEVFVYAKRTELNNKRQIIIKDLKWQKK